MNKNNSNNFTEIEFQVVDRGFGNELNQALMFADEKPETISLSDISFRNSQYANVILTDKESKLLQLIINKFCLLPTAKYGKDFIAKMQQSNTCRAEVIGMLEEIIIPYIRSFTGWTSTPLPDGSYLE